MKTYKVKDIIEPDFGCEGVPEGEEPCCEVLLENADGTIMTVKTPDAELYRKNIIVGCIVGYDGAEMTRLCLTDT